MCSLYNESIVGRLEEGDVDERGGEEIEDNHQIHKGMAHAASCFPQACREVKLGDVSKNEIWIKLPNGGLVTAS